MKLLQKLINIGISQVDSKSEVFRIRVININCLLSIFINIVCVLVFIQNGILNMSYSIILFLGTTGFILVLYLHFLGEISVAGSFMSGLALLFLCGLCLICDPDIDTKYLFISGGISLFYTLKEQRNIIIALITYLIAFIIFCFFDMHQAHLTSTQEYQTIILINIIIIVSFITNGVTTYKYNQFRIEELHEREEKLVKTQKELEQSNRLKSTFLANMSHEIRTPMNSILGFSKILTQKKLPEEERTKLANIIHIGSQQLLHIVNDILDISKIETEQIKVEEETVDISKLLDGVYKFFEYQAKQKGLNLSYTLPSKKNFFIRTDAQKVRQILYNLLSNALKFTDKGGVQINIEITPNEEFIEFQVKDTGIGILQKNQTKIFDRFQQVTDRRGEVINGTGLGLAISKGFAELLKGDILVLSDLRYGSTFTLSIPFQPVKTTSVVVKEKTNEITQTCTILLAEDVKFNTLLIKKILDTPKVILHCVEDGKAAVDFALNEPPPDLILMDINMPVLDGKEAMKIIKQTRPNLPIIALTAFGMNNERIALLEAGFDGFVPKPVQDGVLIQSINTLLV